MCESRKQGVAEGAAAPRGKRDTGKTRENEIADSTKQVFWFCDESPPGDQRERREPPRRETITSPVMPPVPHRKQKCKWRKHIEYETLAADSLRRTYGSNGIAPLSPSRPPRQLLSSQSAARFSSPPCRASAARQAASSKPSCIRDSSVASSTAGGGEGAAGSKGGAGREGTEGGEATADAADAAGAEGAASNSRTTGCAAVASGCSSAAGGVASPPPAPGGVARIAASIAADPWAAGK